MFVGEVVPPTTLQGLAARHHVREERLEVGRYDGYRQRHYRHADDGAQTGEDAAEPRVRH